MRESSCRKHGRRCGQAAADSGKLCAQILSGKRRPEIDVEIAFDTKCRRVCALFPESVSDGLASDNTSRNQTDTADTKALSAKAAYPKRLPAGQAAAAAAAAHPALWQRKMPDGKGSGAETQADLSHPSLPAEAPAYIPRSIPP